ncbi:hypothetical protein JKP88DRAFT_228640 [Tribonema minus]|uniref:W2 domain-containing protein n=1 Tax=Tribonema minus TaxID=303371 RepID=A0A835YLD9_9STRA|nr:hypothetical protein JKP88DRAFT_228640 [Tribonema minus]
MFAHEKGFPKTEKDNMVQTLFTLLNIKEICDEDAYAEWKDDVDDATPGRKETIVQTLKFFEWLEAEEEEDEDEDEDDD